MNLKQKINAFKLLASYNYQLTHSYGLPKILQVELTNFCNLTCPMCPRKDMTRKVGYMSFDLFKKIIDDFGEYTPRLWLHHFGDSLFHPHFEKFIDYTAAKGIFTSLSTNITPLTPKVCERVLNSNLDEIILSLDSTNPKTYKKLRQPSDYQAVMRNLEYFLELKNKRRKQTPKTRIQIIVMDENRGEIDDFKKKWQDKVDEIIVKEFYGWGGWVDNKFNSEYSKPPLMHACNHFWETVVILWDGRLVPCCIDFDAKLVLGDLNKNSINEIWNSERMKALRRAQINKNFKNGLCDNCDAVASKPDKMFFMRFLKELIK